MGVAERLVNRREALVGTGLVGAGALAALIAACGTNAAQDTANTGPTALEGTWRLDVTLDDGTKHQALILCTKDGGVGVSATLASDSFATGYGAWTRSGSQYLITFEAYVVTAGAFGGSLRIRAVPAINQSGDQLTAQVKFEVQAPGSSSFAAGGSAMWAGSRIKPLPL